MPCLIGSLIAPTVPLPERKLTPRMSEDHPSWYAKGWPNIWLPYTQMKTAIAPLAIDKTDGVRLYLSDGRVLIDGIASWWSAVHGYNHPKIVGAITQQVSKMPHVMLGGLLHEKVSLLAHRLAGLSLGEDARVFFSDSGSVAVEVAMKMAVQYWINSGQTGRTRFVSFEGNYHGDTFATMSVCDPSEGMHSLFKDVSPPQLIAPLPRDEPSHKAYEALLDRHGDHIAAIVVEPLIQGAIGMRMFEPETLERMLGGARSRGIPIICDEIFTGLGRTGTMFAYEKTTVTPDIITLSKALTGGTVPLAATIAKAAIFDAFWSDDPDAALMHGPTFMGNATGCAAALASLDLFAEEPRLDQIAAIEAVLAEELKPLADLAAVKDVRVMGAVGAVELHENAAPNELKRRFIEQGVWLRPIGNVIYTTPSYTIDETDLKKLTGAIAKVVGSL